MNSEKVMMDVDCSGRDGWERDGAEGRGEEMRAGWDSLSVSGATRLSP